MINTENYNQEHIIQDLKKHTIKEVLTKYNITWKELIHIQTHKSLTNNPKATYIHKTKKGKYCVNKIIDGKQVYYGEYNTKKDAETIVDEMKKHYWNIERLEDIKKEHNIQSLK